MKTVQVKISEEIYQKLMEKRERQAKRLNRRRSPISTLLGDALTYGILSFAVDENRWEREAANAKTAAILPPGGCVTA